MTEAQGNVSEIKDETLPVEESVKMEEADGEAGLALKGFLGLPESCLSLPFPHQIMGLTEIHAHCL